MLEEIIITILIIIIVFLIYNYFNHSSESFISKSGGSRSQMPTKNIQLVTKPMQKVPTNNNSTPQIDLAGAIPLDFDFKDYSQTLADQNSDLTYYYNDEIDQSKFNETAFNIVNSVDMIDYGNVKTGLDKCNESCSGICYEGGYTGTATCYPMLNRTFDWGTLYKNPTFTYGYNAWNNIDNIK
jgi:hypothetical protein